MSAKGEKLFAVSEVATRLGVSELWVRQLISQKRLAIVRHDWRVFVTAESIDGFLRARQVRQAAATDDGLWATEEKVVAAVERHFKTLGWRRVSKANTRIREHGIDLVMMRETERLAIEAKGYPARTYSEGPKAGQLKTYPATLARSYMGGLLLTTLLVREAQPEYLVAIAVPDRTTFTGLVKRLSVPLRQLGVGAYVVDAKGLVTEVIAPKSRRRRTPAVSR